MRKNRLTCLAGYYQSSGEVKEAASDAEAMNECYLLLASHGSLSLLSYTAHAHMPRNDTHSELGPATSTNN